ncbi:MAG: hypothetical protein DI549_10745 [Ancylobacter novellus]|uniref:Uncharacterized protein n=1 Tax=Ancylobacter novellus TaxID=921 RepID=A0A2W5QV83_ANCNO|nr:MAG: hypothetical protein DI549_10745 [Ancylobacter novellus]
MSVVTLYRGEIAPEVVLEIPGAVFDGSVIDLEIAGQPIGAAPVTFFLSTEDGLDLVGSNLLRFYPSPEMIESLPLGQNTAGDVFRHIEGRREKIGSCTIEVLGAGKYKGATQLVVLGPVLQGPPPWVHRGPWAPGTYPAKSSTSHNGSTWLTLVETDDEPGVGADWEVLLNGTGAAADRAAAAASAAAAGTAAGIATGAAGTAVGAAEMTAQDRVATGEDRVATGQDRAAVGTDKAAVEAYYNKIVAAPKTIAAATYTLLLDDIGRVLRFTNAAGCVLTLPAAIAAVPGWWVPLRRTAGPVTWMAEVGSAIKPDSAVTAGISGQWTTVTLSVDSAGVWLIEGVLT